MYTAKIDKNSEVKEKKISNFRELKIWQMGKEITLEIFKVTEPYCRTDHSGLCNQMRRAALSVASNVAEGFNRFHVGEYKQFLFIALGSCAELETQLEIANALGFIKAEKMKQLLENINHESRMIRSLINKLKQNNP